MKIVIQRVKHASVTVQNLKIAQIQHGFLILLGIEQNDSMQDVQALAAKTTKLRIFSDDQDKMNRSITDVGGQILLVSQFTLCAQTRHGNRPAFVKAMNPTDAERLYQNFGAALKTSGIDVQFGQFGAMMDVELLNDGPVTIIIESQNGVILD